LRVRNLIYYIEATSLFCLRSIEVIDLKHLMCQIKAIAIKRFLQVDLRTIY
jgi:hypothetical protein